MQAIYHSYYRTRQAVRAYRAAHPVLFRVTLALLLIPGYYGGQALGAAYVYLMLAI